MVMIMNKEDLNYYHKLKTQDNVYKQQGAIIDDILKKTDNKESIFGISTKIVFDNKDTRSFNLDQLGLLSEECQKAYKNYLKVLLDSLKSGYEENQLRIKIIESKEQ